MTDKETDQIAAEALLEFRGWKDWPYEPIEGAKETEDECFLRVIKSAIEKATEQIRQQMDFLAKDLATKWAEETVEEIWDRACPKSGIKPLPHFFQAVADAHNTTLQPQSGEPCPVCGSISDRTKEQLADEIAKLIKIGSTVTAAQSNDTKRLDWLLAMIAASSTQTALELFKELKAVYDRSDIDAAMRKET